MNATNPTEQSLRLAQLGVNRAISELFSRGDPARLLLTGSSTDGTVPFNWQKIKACINLSCEARRLAKALHDVRKQR